jgi:hypothetical protein
MQRAVGTEHSRRTCDRAHYFPACPAAFGAAGPAFLFYVYYKLLSVRDVLICIL